MPASRPAGPRLTLFTTVLSLFLMVALLVGSAVTLANYLEARKTAVKVAGDAFHATINQINERRLAFFAPVFMIMDLFPNTPALQQADGSKDSVIQLVLSSLKSNPQISAVYIGYENGNYFQILSISESEKAFVARLGGPPSPDTQFRIYRSAVMANAPRPGDFSTPTIVSSERPSSMLHSTTPVAAIGIAMHCRSETTLSERRPTSSRPRLKWE
jgi:hypothetical protein